MDSVLLEKLIVKGCLTDTNYIANLSNVFVKEYFDNQVASKIYGYVIEHFLTYKKLAPKSAIISEFDKDGNTDVADFFNEVESIDFNYSSNYDFLFTETNNYLKEKAVKKAFLDGVQIINQKGDLGITRKLIEDALAKDLKVDLGLDYFGMLSERLTRLMGPGDIRIPTGFPTLDEYISGGLPPYTLTVMVAKIHGFKSTWLANMCARQTMMGYSPVLVSLEMSEDAFAQRIDSIYSLLDINKMYRERQLKNTLLKSLKDLKNKPNRGNLYIKQFPTGKATVDDYRKYLRELKIRGINPSIFVCDYLNLMKPQYKTKGDMYTDVKSVAEELRALSFEFLIPVVSVSQLNREGMKVSFDEVDFTYISECLSLDTNVLLWDGKIYVNEKICNLKKDDVIKGSNGNVSVKRVFSKKIKKMYKIKTKSGKEIICSADHKFPTSEGIKNIKTGIKVGDKLNSL